MQVADVHKQLDAFVENLYLHPDGDTALGKAYWAGGPQLPESAAMDSTLLGRKAMKSMVSMRNSADEMALASQQAQAIARNTKIAAVRAYEALKSNEVILEREEAATLNRPLGTSWRAEEGGMSPATAELSSSVRYDEHGKPTGGAPGGGAGGLGGEEPVDPTVFFLKKDLQDAFAMVKKVSVDAQIQANAITKKYHEVQHASRAITEALKYPGAALPPTIAPVMLKPPRRPRDLSPFWLDVPYGISSGGDPYAVHDGAARDSAAETIMGVPGFNPFEGTVPMSEAGLAGIYGKIGGTQKGGSIAGNIGAASLDKQLLASTGEGRSATKTKWTPGAAVWDEHSLRAGLDLKGGGGGALGGMAKML